MVEIYIVGHALDQIRERSVLDPKQVKYILNQGQTLPLGYEPGTNRKHVLFYSVPDDEYFVVIYDERVGKVITFLPSHFHNRWKVLPEQEEAARRLALGDPEPVPLLAVDSELSVSDGSNDSKSGFQPADADTGDALPSKLICSCCYHNRTSGYQQTINLGGFPARPYQFDGRRLMDDPAGRRKVYQKLVRKLKDRGEPSLIMIKLGQKGRPVWSFPVPVDWRERYL